MTRRDFALLALILLLGAGMSITHRIKQGILPVGVHVEGLEFLQGPLHTFSETGEHELAPGDRIVVEGRGDVHVLAWSENKVHVELKKQVHGEKEEEARRTASELKLALHPSPGLLTIRAEGSPSTYISADLSVTLPESTRLQVITTKGSVVVQGIRQDVLIRAAHGDVDVADLGGRVEVINDGGGITLHRVQGPVILRTAHANVEASDLESSAEVNCDHGDVQLTRVAGRVQVTQSHGSVRVTEAGSEAHVNTGNSDVTLSGVRGHAEVIGEHGSIRAERVQGDLKLTAPHCEVEVENLGGSLTANLQGDPLTAASIQGGVKIVASASDVKLTDVKGPIEVSGTHTPVEVIRPGANVEVNTTNQEIRLISPAARGFRIDARSDQGEVESDLEALHVSGERPPHFAGAVGDGGIRYRLTTSHATISILTTSAAAARKKDEDDPDE